MRFPRWIAALALVTGTSVALAQQPAQPGGTTPADQPTTTQPTTTPPTAAPATPTTPVAEAPPQQALDLPKAADQLRDKGIPEGEVKKALDAARDEKLSAAEAGMLFNDLAKMQLPSDREQVNRFGDVVEDQLGKGLRGASLVKAVETDLSAPAKGETRGDETKPDTTTTPGGAPPANP